MDNSKQLALPTVVSMCTGYGGIERGLELAGFEFRTILNVEIEAYCCALLAKKMEKNAIDPAPIWTDVKTLPSKMFRDRVSVLLAGYPCQPFSSAGKRQGTDDPRHLWPYIKNHIRTMRPVRCFFENVQGHISLGLQEVIGDLEAEGYRTTWGIFSAVQAGAPHQRKRVYIMADRKGEFSKRGFYERDNAGQPQKAIRSRSGAVADFKERWPAVPGKDQYEWEEPRTIWKTKPELGGTLDGFANRVDRLRLLGNGVVPQTAAMAWLELSQRLEND